MTELKVVADDEVGRGIFERQKALLANLEGYVRLMFGSNKTIADIFWEYGEKGEQQMNTLLDAFAPEGGPRFLKGDADPLMTALLAMREDGKPPARPVVECRCALLLSCIFGIQCIGFLETAKRWNAVLYYGESKYYFGCFLSAGKALYGEQSMSKFSQKGALAKLENDPKQAAKTMVKECWIEWQKEPARYASKSAFALDMLSKFEDLQNQAVIAGWCRAWEEHPAG